MNVSLVALFPTHLNLNGDLANIKVLQERLAWRNVSTEVTFVNKGDNIPDDADFLLIGHGSEAAWTDLQEDLNRLRPRIRESFERGVAGLAVASGYERIFQLDASASLDIIAKPVSRTERVSRFYLAQLEDHNALGYINSDADLPALTRINNLFGTLLHGPVLAKNEWLADSIINCIFEMRGAELPELREKEKAGLVADLISKIWELEEPLARE